jgi:hypothetical protein
MGSVTMLCGARRAIRCRRVRGARRVGRIRLDFARMVRSPGATPRRPMGVGKGFVIPLAPIGHGREPPAAAYMPGAGGGRLATRGGGSAARDETPQRNKGGRPHE